MAAGTSYETTTDADTVRAWCQRAVAADPVANTIFGAIASSVDSGGAAPWATRAVEDPQLLAARSQAHTPVTATASWSDAPGLAGALAGLAPPPAALAGRPDLIAQVVDALGRPVTATMSERLFRCDELVEPVGVTGSARLAQPVDVPWLAGWFTEYMLEAFGRVPPGFDGAGMVERGVLASRCWIWLDEAGEPVSYAVRHPAQSGVSRIGPVYTPVAARGRGYGSAATAAATRDVMADGAVACLFTDLANPTSNKIYQALGYRPVLDRTLVRFD